MPISSNQQVKPTSAAATSTPATNPSSSSSLHPCLRIYGKCNFGKNCKYAKLPANCCLSFLKGKCKSNSCSYPHIAIGGSLPNNTTSTKNVSLPVPSSSPATSEDVEQNEICDLMMILCSQEEEETEPEIKVEVEKKEDKCSALQREIEALKKQHATALQQLQTQHDARIKAEKERTAKIEKELKESNAKHSLLQDITRFFQEQLPGFILSSSSCAATATATADKSKERASLVDELKSLNEKVEAEALALRRAPLLAKVFEVASAEFNKQKNSCARQYASLVPNECLFSDCSTVADQFFKACPDTVFANDLFDAKTGELNKERFAISFHGTRGGATTAAALNIQCGGFDPARRSGQALGAGEYSAQHVATALGYSAGAVLAVLIYKPQNENEKNSKSSRGAQKFGPVNIHNGGSIFVVENPKDRSCTYMLPLGCAYNYGQVKTQTLERKCGCVEKQAKRAIEEAKGVSENSNEEMGRKLFKGKRFFMKEKMVKNTTTTAVEKENDDDEKEKEKEKEQENSFKQMDDISNRVLLKALYQPKPSLFKAAAVDDEEEKKVTNDKQKKNKKNSKPKKQKKTQSGDQEQEKKKKHPELHYVMLGEKEEKEVCSVNLNKMEMVNMKSGKVYDLGVWTVNK